MVAILHNANSERGTDIESEHKEKVFVKGDVKEVLFVNSMSICKQATHVLSSATAIAGLLLSGPNHPQSVSLARGVGPATLALAGDVSLKSTYSTLETRPLLSCITPPG